MSNKINVFGNSSELNSLYLIDISDHVTHFGVASQSEFETLLGYGGYGYDSSNPDVYPYKTQGYNTDAFILQLLTNISWMMGRMPIGTTVGDRLDTIDDKLAENISSNELMQVMSSITGTGIFNNRFNGNPIQINQTPTGISFIISSITSVAVGSKGLYQIRELGNMSVDIDVTQYSTLDQGTVLEFEYYAVLADSTGASLNWAASIPPSQIVDLTDDSRVEIDYDTLPYGLMPIEYQARTSGQVFEYYSAGLLVNRLTSEEVIEDDLLLRAGSLYKLYTFRLVVTQGTNTIESFEAIKHFEPLPSMTQLLNYQKEALSGTGSSVVLSRDDVTIDYESTIIPFTIAAGSMLGPYKYNAEPLNRYIKSDYRSLASLVGTDYATIKGRLPGSKLPETRTFYAPGHGDVKPTDRFLDGSRIWLCKTDFEFGKTDYMFSTEFIINGPDGQSKLINLNEENILTIYGDVKLGNISSPITSSNLTNGIKMSTVTSLANKNQFLTFDYTTIDSNALNSYDLRSGLSINSRLPFLPELKYRRHDTLSPGVELRINGDKLEIYNELYYNDALNGVLTNGTVWIEFTPEDDLDYLINDTDIESVKWILIEDMVLDNDIMVATQNDIDGTFADGGFDYAFSQIGELWEDSNRQDAEISTTNKSIDSTNSSINALNTNLSFQINELDTKIIQCESDISDINGDINDVNDLIDSNHTDVKNDISGLSNEIVTLFKNDDDHDVEIDNINTMMDSLKSSIDIILDTNAFGMAMEVLWEVFKLSYLDSFCEVLIDSIDLTSEYTDDEDNPELMPKLVDIGESTSNFKLYFIELLDVIAGESESDGESDEESNEESFNPLNYYSLFVVSPSSEDNKLSISASISATVKIWGLRISPKEYYSKSEVDALITQLKTELGE